MNDLRPSVPGWILDYVMLDEHGITTDSHKVAAACSMAHKSVLRRIRTVVAVTGDRRHNFVPTIIHRPNPKGGEPIPSPGYKLTRDGFTQLALGFTGDKAIRMRDTFTEAFGLMAKELLWKRCHAHDRRDTESLVAASIGSSLLLQRKRALPGLRAEERELQEQLQLPMDLLPLE